MNTNRLRNFVTGILALAAMLMLTPAIFGQGVTTADINGFIQTSDGKPVVGAKVTALHVPSGTRGTAVTRPNGEYNIVGLRTGGPYTVTVEGPGFTSQSTSGINLDIGSTSRQDFTVSNEVVKLEAVTVTGGQDTVFDSGAMGTQTNYGAPQIQVITSVRQDVQDLENLDPRANLQQSANGDANYTLSVQGQNPRESLFLIDGVVASDNFGLNSNGYAGLRNPVPLPWIESVALALNDYDVVYSGFLGGVLNTTLKSGTNEFHGSLYEMYTGTHFRGPDPVIGALGPHEGVQVHTSGIALSGPLIKDKLFFFVGYEAFREIAQPPAQSFIVTDPQLNQIIATAVSRGTTNPGSFIQPIHAWEQNFVGKIDWNISDDHKFEVTFRHTDGLFPLVYNYTNTNETSLSGSWYSSHRTDQSLTAKFNSNWEKLVPGFTTELEGTYRRYNGTANLLGTDTPSAVITNVQGTSLSAGPYSLYLGPSPFYQVNQLYTSELEEHAYGEYSIGAHTFKFGAVVDRMEMTNAFIPNYFGTYNFTNVADYLNGTPTGVSLAAPAPGFTLAQAIAHYAQLNIAPLIQDTWKPTGRLTLTAGVRMDYPDEPAKPPVNPIYVAATGQTNTTTIDGNYTISPRVGFNYDLPTERKTQIRGGAGLFVGAPPFVWLENSFSTAGQTTSYTINNSSVPIANYTYTGNPSTQPVPPVAAAVPVPSLDVLDKNFHLPANWKENLAIDHKLPFWDITMTLEADFSQVQEDITYYQTNLKKAVTPGSAYMPDGAIRYNGNITPGSLAASVQQPNVPPVAQNQNGAAFYAAASSQSTPTLENNTALGPVYELANTNKGASQEYTIMFNRPMKNNWAWSLAYTHTHATQVSTLGGTTASGGYGANTFVNPNDNVAYNSAFAEPDKFVATIARRFHFFPYHDTTTTLSAQFLAQTGVPFSYTFKGDADGSGLSNASLFYVPTGPSDPKVAWLSTTERDNFFNTYLPQHPDLAKYGGRVVPRNAFYSPWEKTVNLHFEQQLPVYGPAHLTVFADCFNFANLLDHNWGVVTNYGVYNDQGGRQTVAGTGYNQAGNGGAGQYIYTFNSATTALPTIYSDQSRWQVQIGARLDF